jgi:hypothetical protein
MRPVELARRAFEDTGDRAVPQFTDPAQASSLEVTGWDDTGARVDQLQGRAEGRPLGHPQPQRLPGRRHRAHGQGRRLVHRREEGRPAQRAGRGPRPFGVEDPSDEGQGPRPAHHHQGCRRHRAGRRHRRQEDRGQGGLPLRPPAHAADGRSACTPRSSRSTSRPTSPTGSRRTCSRSSRTRSPSFLSDPYKVDEAQGKVTNRDPVLMNREQDPSNPDDKQGKWVLAEGAVGIDGKELDATKIRQVISAVDRLQIVGVRPRPEQLTLQALQSKGFFVTPDGKPACSATRARSRPSATTASSTPSTSARSRSTRAWPSPPAPRTAPSPPRPRRARRRRTPTASCSSTSPTTRPATPRPEPAGPPPDEPEGAKRAKQLQARFDKWFYVISDASFKQIHKDKAEFFKDASPDSGPTAPVPGAPAKPAKAPEARQEARDPGSGSLNAAAIEHRASLVRCTKLARFVSRASFGIAPATTGCHDRHGRA